MDDITNVPAALIVSLQNQRRESLKEIQRLRQSLREARKLIEATVNSVRQFKIILAGHETLHVNTEVLEAAYKWLEENGDA